MGFVPTRDLAVANAFYGELLGLRLLTATSLANVYDVGGGRLCLVRADNVEPTGETAFALSVIDLPATVARLREVGVELIEYPGLGQDADGAWTSPSGALVVWFNDPDGHILSLIQVPD